MDKEKDLEAKEKKIKKTNKVSEGNILLKNTEKIGADEKKATSEDEKVDIAAASIAEVSNELSNSSDEKSGEGEIKFVASKSDNVKSKKYKENIKKFFTPVPCENGKKRSPFGKLARKLSKRWFIDAFTGMSQGLFVTLIAGLIIKQIGSLINIGGVNFAGQLFISIGNIATFLTGVGIGVGIAHSLKANKLVIFACAIAGFIGAQANNFISGAFSNASGFAALFAKSVPAGNPIGAYVCAIISAEIGILIQGKTKLDILLVPLAVMIAALASAYIAQPAIWLIDKVGEGVKLATEIQPIIMGIVISVVVGLLLTLPTSSAAICIAIGIGRVNGVDIGTIAGGAAVVGCCCQMVGFAVMSFKENGISGLISQGLGTSMLQIPNLMKNPKILIPPVVASAILGPIATSVFRLKCTSAGAGMGTSGLVGIIDVISANAGEMNGWLLALGVILLMIVLPALISYFVCLWLRKIGWIKEGDLKLKD